jgi:hypothetical protein
MLQWEYTKINLNDSPRKTEDIDLLNDAGEKGWELIAISPNNMAYLKRAIEEPAPAQAAATPARTTLRKTAATTAK